MAVKIDNLSDFTHDSKETGIIVELENGDRVFVDKKGITRNLTKQTAELWKETFGLDKFGDDFIPNIPQEIKDYLNDKDLVLTSNSLLKIVANERTEYIGNIRSTLEKPDFVIKHDENLIFAKMIDERLFFTSVGREFDTRAVVISNAPKKDKEIINRILNSEVLYQSPNFGVLRYNKLLQEQRSMPNTTDNNEIISQQSKQHNPNDRLVINIYGSAGVGKTTLAKKLHSFMIEFSKEQQKYNKFEPQLKPELVSEFATELIKQGKFEELKNQPFVTQGQISNLEKGFEKSNLVITDSPLGLGRIYNQDYTKANEVSNLIQKAEQNYNSIDLFLSHNDETAKTYNMQGRVHTLEQSVEKEKELLSNLQVSGKKFILINRNEDLEMIFARIQVTPQWQIFEANQMNISTNNDKNRNISNKNDRGLF